MSSSALKYLDLGVEGLAPYVVYHACCYVENQQFFSTGPSPELARKNSAIKACTIIYDANFDDVVNILYLC